MTAKPLAYASGCVEPPERDLTIGDALREAARLACDVVALREGELTQPACLTYSELLASCEGIARALLKRFPVGSHVALWADNVIEYHVLQYAISLAGMVMVSVNPAFRQQEAEYILEQSESVAVFAVKEFRGRSPLTMAKVLREGLPGLREVFDISCCLDLIDPTDSSTLPEVSPASPAVLLYSSGTTGMPKGAVLSHRGITNNAREAAIRVTAGHTINVVWLVCLPIFHLGGCVVAAIGTLMLHGTLVPIRSFEPGKALQLIEHMDVTVTNVVPTMMQAMLEHPSFTSTDLASMRSIMLGGTTIPSNLVERVRSIGIDVVVAYGQTEAAMVSATKPSDSTHDIVNTCGTALPHVEMRVCDPESGEPLRAGEVGEVQARGSLALIEYYKNPSATTSTIDHAGWVKTGDLGFMDEHGYLSIVGRLKDMIIRGGENIYPREIEDLLAAQSGVVEAAVVGVPDDYYGEVATAFVQPVPGIRLRAAELRAVLAQHLSGYKIPSYWVFVDSFPQTASGKVKKHVLRDSWVAGDFIPESVL